MNPVKAITQFLQERLQATAPEGDTLHNRIAMDRIPPDFANSESAIEIQIQSGGQPMAEMPVTRYQVAIQCFGGTSDFDAASTVSSRVFFALHNAVGAPAEAGLMFAQRATTSRMYEPATGWPVVVDIYEIEILDTTGEQT